MLIEEFGATDEELKRCESLSDEDLSKAYYTMQLCRDFENESATKRTWRVRFVVSCTSTTVKSLFRRSWRIRSARMT